VPQTFNSFWYGNELSPLEWACLSSFIERGHRFRLFCYDSICVPQGVVLEDASKITPKDQLFLVDGNVAAFTDLFRYEIIQRSGEWWTDTDVYCLRDDIPDCDYAWADEDQDQINGAILKFPSDDPTLLEISRSAHAIGSQSKIWCELGPSLLTKHLAGKVFDNHFGNRDYFYPLHWLETFLFWIPYQNDQVKLRCKNAFFVHFWSSVFGQLGIDRHVTPPNGSFLDVIYGPIVRRFNLRKLDANAYQHTLEQMKAWINSGPIIESSKRKIGYDISTYSFDSFDDQRRSYGAFPD
jgi:hypothetical protein